MMAYVVSEARRFGLIPIDWAVLRRWVCEAYFGARV